MSCSKLTVSTGGDVGGGGVGSGSLTPANQPARDADGSSIGVNAPPVRRALSMHP